MICDMGQQVQRVPRTDGRRRVFRDSSGSRWRVWWSPDARTAATAQGFCVWPPGIWFESLEGARQRFLFHPGPSGGELQRMPAAWLRRWLAKADTAITSPRS